MKTQSWVYINIPRIDLNHRFSFNASYSELLGTIYHAHATRNIDELVSFLWGIDTEKRDLPNNGKNMFARFPGSSIVNSKYDGIVIAVGFY